MIEWGDGIYGAEAAARQYFRTSAAQLGPQESALLAAALVNPRLLDPGHPTARLQTTSADDPAAHGQRDAASRLRDAGVPSIEPCRRVPSTPGPPDALPGEPIPVEKVPTGRGGDIRPDGSR